LHLAELVKRLDTRSLASISYLSNNKWCVRIGAEIAADVWCIRDALRGIGVGPGMRIGIAAANSYEWIVADLALLELRCVSVAVPESMADDLEPLADRFGLALILVDGSAPAARKRPWIVRLRDLVGELAAKSIRPGAVILPEQQVFETPALVFSSGSSGRLKCLCISRAGIENVVRRFVDAYELRDDDAALVFLPLSNIQQRVIVYGALWFGLEAVLVSPAALFGALRDRRPTVVIAPPLLFETIHARYQELPLPKRVAAMAAVGIARRLPARARRALLRRVFRAVHEWFGGRLRLAITGMAQIRVSTLRFFRAIDIPLYEAYGLTECGIVAGNRPGAERMGAVGRPFEPGAVTTAPDGEILVRTNAPLATGYYDEADGGDTFGARSLIRTGDIGRFDAQGYLYISGRKKEIIVTAGGFKIHPEVVESGINECPVVDRSAVFGGEPAADLTAVVTVRRTTSDEDIRCIEKHLRTINDRLPHGVRVRAVVVSEVAFSIDAGTLTRNLKISRAGIYQEYRDRLTGRNGMVVVKPTHLGTVKVERPNTSFTTPLSDADSAEPPPSAKDDRRR
jgi:long-subunit acyl-CoA synthetase (AMP-forming)